jgi:hypothetical protein
MCDKMELGDIYEKLDEMHSLMYALQPETDLDWEKVRISAAISAMNGLLASERNKLLHWSRDWCVEQSVKYADKLINELRKKNNG